MQNDQEPKTSEEQLRAMYEDERTQNRIQEHLTNEHDVITEQDIANISTRIFNPENEMETGVAETDAVFEKTTVEEEKSGEKIADDNDDPQIQTPWNIIG